MSREYPLRTLHELAITYMSSNRSFAPTGPYCDGTRAVARDGRQHETESQLRLRLQHARRAACCRGAVPLHRLAVVTDDRRAGDEPQFCVGRRQRIALAGDDPKVGLTGLLTIR